MSGLPSVEHPLQEAEAEAAFGAMLDGSLADEDIAQFLIALSERGETAAEIAGAARAMRARLIPVEAPANAIDVCGTGGDGHHTLNVSTAVALVVAACGVPVAKHGNRAASSKAGAADTLEALGLDLDRAMDTAEETLGDLGICFLFAGKHHPAMGRIMPIRKKLGRRTIFNLMGPLANPANVRRQLVGIARPAYVPIYADALARLGTEHSFVVSGDEGDTLTIVDEPIVLTPASLPNGVVGTPYNQDIDASGGGITPYSFSITGGALPPGLTLAADGEISGTPIAQGTFNFDVTAHDRFMAASGSGAYSVTIMAPEIGIDPTTLPIATVGTAYEQPLTASGGTTPYSYAVTGGSLPAGMGMDGDGIIDGTPEVSGDFAFTVTATDAHAQVGDQGFTLSVIAPVIGIAPTAVPDATVGVDYEVLFVATGGNGPHTFAVTAGSLPAGLFLSSDGTLNGAPTTPGDYEFTVTATDTFNQTGGQAYDISVHNAVIAISPASVPAGVVGTAFSQALSASGGTGPYSYMISGGSLPQGMGMDGDGIIDGTPEEPGSFGFSVTATDAFGQTGEKNYSLSINAPTILLSPATLPDGEVGSEYGQVLIASGGNAPYSFALSAGALPAGMHFDSDGTLAGTPTVAGNFGLTITATDNYDQTGTQAYVLAISGATITLGPTSLPNGAVGLAYQQALSASGGSDPYSFAITDGNLPSGMALGQAIEATDEATGGYPVHYMINCAHPTHFAGVITETAPWTSRLGGLRANASSLSHAELDEALELDRGDPADLAARYQELRSLVPSLHVVGGCCGTDHHHVGAIATAACAR